ncbi:hypothetical protein EV356DRAFT_516657 [Viridothelium virens]|uniref:Prion-inhibition and propagation HeLo domain-containing protein n=1 Tax=Viridothelium virens TaxID=1048519 RepID=A0A6A6HL31_VIRVR|nr:hypothetical protein EV356DRAFT_516657 [Viridothelium virens]
MDTVGVVFSTLGLTGLFSNAIDCFKYIQIAKSYERDFATGQLRLDLAGLQLSRWGKSVGISGDIQNDDGLVDILGSADDVKMAKETLKQILTLITDAAMKCAQYRNTRLSQDQGPSALHVLDNVQPAYAALHEAIMETVETRKNKSKLLTKTKWALSGREDLQTLVDSIVKLVGQLIELFPERKTEHLELCRAEVDKLLREENVEPLARGASSLHDQALMQTIEQSRFARGGHSYSKFEFEEVEGLLNGNVVDSRYHGMIRTHSQHTYEGFTIKKSKNITNGNRFQGTEEGGPGR